MPVSLAIPNAKALDTGVWNAKLNPLDLCISLAAVPKHVGPISVVLVSKAASFDCATNTLSIDLVSTRILNLGCTDDALIIALSEGDIEERFPKFVVRVAGHDPRPISALQLTPDGGIPHSVFPMRKSRTQPAAPAISGAEYVDRRLKRVSSRGEG
jgi:hypothetical protein